MIYGPTILFALGEGAVIPLIPIIAAQLGADVAHCRAGRLRAGGRTALRQHPGRMGRRAHR
jgi:hypothetical protein